MSTRVPRGIRNHNAGNIRKSNDPWQGLAPEQNDPEFLTFRSPEWGIRALARVLVSYQERHGLNTIEGIINRWAPPKGDRTPGRPGGEYTQDTSAYIGHVAAMVGVTRDQTINVKRYSVMRPLVVAIIQHENGRQPYDAATIDAGLKLAGIVPPPRAVPRGPEGYGMVTTSFGGIGATVTEGAQQMSAMSGGTSQILQFAFLLLMMGGFGLTIYGMVKRERRESLPDEDGPNDFNQREENF